MTFFIGTDEAGYGPNLGPLTITATAWQFPSGTTAAQCWDLLSDSVSQSVSEQPDCLQIADSKQVYSSGRSIESLEKTVLTLLKQLGSSPARFRDCGAAVCDDRFSAGLKTDVCCSAGAVSLPVAAADHGLADCRRRFQETLKTADVQLVAVHSRVVFPAEFNQLVDASGSKGVVLSRETLKLVADIVRQHQPAAADVICDKHGGRNRYDELLSEAFDDQMVFRLEEGRPLSRYRMNEIKFRFQTKAEEHLPVAAASMVSKYLREIAMLEFNAYWASLLPDLKPTMGYPVDATRFMEQIEPLLEANSIDRDSLWRRR